MPISEKAAAEMLEIMERHLKHNPQEITPEANRFTALCRVIADGGGVSDEASEFMHDYIYEMS